MFDSEPQMQGMPPEEQSRKAIGHVLIQIRDHPHVGWYLGFGTESFDLLTEAYATLTNQTIEGIRDRYEPRNATNPKEDA
jgi:hypothetical protein